MPHTSTQHYKLYICMYIYSLYRFTDPIRYVSSIILIDNRYVSTIFYILSLNRSIQPTEICDVEQSLFHIHRKDCVIIMLITVKTMFYSFYAYENGFLNIFSTVNLLNSRVLRIYNHLNRTIHFCSAKLCLHNSVHI